MRRLTDKEWKVLAPLLPKDPPHPKGGRPFLPNRKVLSGIWYVVTSGIPWNDLPSRYGSGSTAWRRLKRWQRDGTWQKIWEQLLVILDQRGILDWDHTVLDAADVVAKKGGDPSVGRRS